MTVKAYFSDQAGAPVLNGMVGSFIAVLDACLVNGFNQVEVSSITRSGSTVTVDCAAPHGYENPLTTYWVTNGAGNVAMIAGAEQAEYNGDWPVTYVSPTVFSFDIGAATPVSPATGTITTKRAPAGFGKVFADTNRGVYRSNDISSRRHFWQVNDVADCPNGQGGRYAGHRGYEHMTGIDQGEYPFPTIAAAGLFGAYIIKSNATDATARHWSLYSDGKTVVICIHPDQGITSPTAVSSYSYTMGFGDLLSPVPDAYATICSGISNGSSSYSANANCGLHLQGNPTTGAGWNALARTYTGAAKPVWSTAHLGMVFNQGYNMGSHKFLAFPDPLSNRFQLTQVQVYEPFGSGAVHRGALPIYECGVGAVHANREIVKHVVGREGRVFQYIRSGCNYSGSIGGVYIDLSGNAQGKWS